jgi:transposase
MNEVSIIGVDLAKSVFQLHGVDETGKLVLRRQLRRSQMLEFFQRLPGCLVGMEACASAHYWSRELTKLGHEVRLMPFFATNAPPERSLDARTIRERLRQTWENR